MSTAQIKCGELKPVTEEGEKRFAGKVRLIGRLAGDLKLFPHERAGKTDNSPDYEVFYRDASGTSYPIGSGWLKSAANGDFLSLTLTHPDWPQDLNLAAFAESNGSFRLVWSRPRGAVPAQQQAA
ncbi:MAG: DUF736 family protein [Rhizomicrobium sp.]